MVNIIQEIVEATRRACSGKGKFNMYPRTNYEMSEENLKGLLDACKSVPVMMIGSYTPSSPQENANTAWRSLGEKMGFDSMTVQPIQGRGQRFFSAIPNETNIQREERIKKEDEEKRTKRIQAIKEQIAKLQDKLSSEEKPQEATP